MSLNAVERHSSGKISGDLNNGTVIYLHETAQCLSPETILMFLPILMVTSGCISGIMQPSLRQAPLRLL